MHVFQNRWEYSSADGYPEDEHFRGVRRQRPDGANAFADLVEARQLTRGAVAFLFWRGLGLARPGM